jgi:hypothetical protein
VTRIRIFDNRVYNECRIAIGGVTLLAVPLSEWAIWATVCASYGAVEVWKVDGDFFEEGF